MEGEMPKLINAHDVPLTFGEHLRALLGTIGPIKEVVVLSLALFSAAGAVIAYFATKDQLAASECNQNRAALIQTMADRAAALDFELKTKFAQIRHHQSLL